MMRFKNGMVATGSASVTDMTQARIAPVKNSKVKSAPTLGTPNVFSGGK